MECKLYEFTRDDVKKCADLPIFLEGVRYAVSLGFSCSEEWFRGDASILEKLKDMEPEEWYFHLDQYSLPYLSQCEKITEVTSDRGREWIEIDIETREELMRKAVDRYEPAWWTYIHNCEIMAIFILYPMCVTLFPQRTFKVHTQGGHVVIVDDERNVYDLVYQCLELPIGEYLHDFGDPACEIEEDGMIDWYVKSYGWNDMGDLPSAWKEWHSCVRAQ